MIPDLLLGIDAGQTVTKALVFDRTGRETGAGSARVELSSPQPRWVERDLEEVWQATTRAITEALISARVDGDRIAAVGIVGHNDGLYLVDDAHQPVRPAVTAMDTRAHEILAEWQVGPVSDRALQLNGQVPFGGSPSALLAWFGRHDPEVLDRTRWVLYCKDWLRLRLTGEVATDPSEASAALTSAVTQAYDEELLHLFGVREVAGKLPPIRASQEVSGEVHASGAAATGLTAGTPVVTGAHDVDGTAVGTGVVAPGMLGLVAGTFSINQVVSDELRVDPRWQARSFVRAGQHLNMATSPSSATNLDWWRGVFGLAADDQAYDRLEQEVAGTLRTGSDSGMLYHPFLYGSPYGPDATAALLGVRGWHSRGAVVRAIYEGVALGHRVHVDALREQFGFDGPARLSGGAARSPIWSQLFADVLDTEIEILDCREAGARGAALLAALGLGWYDSLDELADMVEISRRHAPDPATRAAMDRAYGRFQAAAEALRPLWPELG